MTNGEKYVCIARTVEKGIKRFGQSKSILSIGLGCEAKYAKILYIQKILMSLIKKQKFLLEFLVELVID